MIEAPHVREKEGRECACESESVNGVTFEVLLSPLARTSVGIDGALSFSLNEEGGPCHKSLPPVIFPSAEMMCRLKKFLRAF